MALSARIPSTVVTNYYVPTIYSQKIHDAVESLLVCWDAIDSSWETQLVKGNILNIPKATNVSAAEVVVDTKGTALNPFNTTGVQLTINQWYEAPIDIDDMTMAQSQVAAEAIAVDRGSYAVAKQIDTSIGALFSALGGSTYPNADGATLDTDVLESLAETLDEADVPRDGKRTLMIDPSALADLLKYDKIVNSLYLKAGDIVQNGEIGNHPVYGCKIRVTNNLTAATTGNYCAMLHSRAIASAAQIQKSWKKVFEELHTTRFHTEALWGVIEVDDAFGKAFYSRKS